MEKIIPALYGYSPDFMLVSAGFDAHKAPPRGGVRVSGEGFESMTKMLKEAAENLCQGGLVSLLEGGYDLEGLSDSVYRHLRVLSEQQRFLEAGKVLGCSREGLVFG